MTIKERLAPAGGWRSSWVFITALFALASFVETLGFGHLAAFTPLYLKQLGVASGDIPQWTGYLSAAAFIIGLPLAPFWGIWADKYSRKVIIVRSAFLEGIIFVVAALSANVWQLLIARILSGFVLGNTGVMYAFVSSVAPKRNWSLAIASIGLGNTLGMSIGPLLGGYLVNQWGIKPLLIIDSILSFLVALLLIFVLVEKQPLVRATGSTIRMLVALGRDVARMPVVLGLFGTYAIMLLGPQLSLPFVPILVEDLYRGPDLPTAIGLITSGFAVTSAIFTPVWGRIGDRKGHRRTLAVATFLLVPVLAAQAFTSDLSQLLVLRAAQGAFQAATPPLLLAMVALHTPEERRASILNLSLFPNYLAWIAGSAMGASIATFNLQALFTTGAFIVVMGLGMLLTLTPKDDPTSTDSSD